VQDEVMKVEKERVH